MIMPEGNSDGSDDGLPDEEDDDDDEENYAHPADIFRARTESLPND